MPTYHYKCNNIKCAHEYTISQSIKSDPLKDCPSCQHPTLERIIYAALAFVKPEAKTVGMLAQRNTEKLGHNGMEDMWARDAERKKLAKAAAREELAARLPANASIPTPQTGDAWYRPGTSGPDMSLSTLNPQEAKKFIEEGKNER